MHFNLTSEQIKNFNDDGYIVLKSSSHDFFLDEIITQVAELYGEQYIKNPSAPIRFQDAWKNIENVRQLAHDPAIISALIQLMGRKPLPFQTLNFPVGTRQAVHSDTIHFNTIPSGFMVGVWVALEDIDMTNGPLIYYPGSHKLPEYSMYDLELGNGYQNYNKYEIKIQKMVDDLGFKPSYGTIKKGEALIWHSNLIHGGHVQTDLTKSRHSQVTHYFFEDCKYYTPMNSEPGSPSYRYPDWIPDRKFNKFSWGAKSFAKRVARKLGFKPY